METRRCFLVLLTCLYYHTQSQALEIKNLSSKVIDVEWHNSTLSYWPFESFWIDNMVRDWSGTNDGKINGNVRPIPGIVGTAIELTGEGSWVDFGFLPGTCFDEPMSCRTGFTIAFWLKLPTFEGNKIIFQMANSRNARGFTVWTRRQRQKKINFSINGRNRIYRSVRTWPTVDWTHITLVWHRQETSLRVYFNGTLEDTVTKATSPKSKGQDSSKVSMVLGASHSKKKNSHMLLDEFAIWNKTLTLKEICQIVGVKTVHGGYSEWSSFSECNETCGHETRIRHRTCTNPLPQNRGRNCSLLGPDHEIAHCHHPLCPIDGGYSQWISFSRCTKSCGTGQMFRTRRCNHPKPAHGGKNCSLLGDSLEARLCNTQSCPINGGFTDWTEFSECSKSCGNGTTISYRNCTNPAPAHGGKNCIGEDIVVYPCNTHPCSIDGGYTEWSAFTNCSKSCGRGSKYRSRSCTNPAPKYKGKECIILGPASETILCNTHHCPIDGGFTSWTEFSRCSKSCGNGTKYRYRNCTNPIPQYEGRNCSRFGTDLETRECNTHECPINGGYTQWTNFTECSKTCGNGTKYRFRHCTNPVPKFGGKNCSVLGRTEEFLYCNTHNCPIDGEYTQWTEFSNCSKSCGNGSKYRYRNCTNPIPQYGGRNCSRLGPDLIVMECNTHECPIDGGYTQWTNFAECSKSCGNGTKYRFRNCTNPIPKFGGRNCSILGAVQESLYCNTHNCPIDGGYTPWSKFSNCSKSCGNGTKYRYRNCTNPVPQYEGRNCSRFGPDLGARECNTHECPINGGYTQWTNFTECSKSCGNGTKHRFRNCTNPIPKFDGRNCSILGAAQASLFCNTHFCAIDGGYTPWSEFSNCSKSCGNGTRYRTRNCTNPVPQHGGKNCSIFGTDNDIIHCNVHFCPIHGGYTLWSNYTECSRSCVGGTQSRNRTCTNPSPMHSGKDCEHIGASNQTRACNTHPCPIHGGFSSWTSFTICSKSCGVGIKSRSRSCSKPAPRHGGTDCEGALVETEACNTHPCPINGGYASWSDFSECSKPCGIGEQQRYRNCTNPTPQHGGENCSVIGASVQERVCNTYPCPIHGGYTKWTVFTICTKSCANGTKTRKRFCVNPEPKHGGMNCSRHGNDIDIRGCNEHPCPVHGGYTTWSNFSECSKSCENGTKSRFRNCTKPIPQHGGANCSHLGPDYEMISCNTHYCPIHGNYSEWTNYTSCSKTCANGTMFRTRPCSNPEPAHGGRSCSEIGPGMDIKYCNVFPCPIDGNYTMWSGFSLCDKTCNNGSKFRTRNCTSPTPQFGGRNCSHVGLPIEIVSCFLRHCLIDGEFGNWSAYGPCSKSCNTGRENRTRLCNSPRPQHGGKDCEGTGIEVVECNTHPCPIDGNYTQWTGLSPCSKTCESGVRVKTRNCSSPSPKYGGKNCSGMGASVFRLTCNTQRCPDIVFNITLNVTDERWSPSLADPSTEAFKMLKYSIQNSIKKIYAKTRSREISKIEVWRIRKGSILVDVILKYYNKLYEGVTPLQNMIYTKGMLDNHHVIPVGFFTVDVPSSAPKALSGHNVSSTKIILSWTPIDDQHTNGNITNYRVIYKKPHRASWYLMKSVLVPNQLSYVVTGLQKFTNYEFRVAGKNERGVGLDSKSINVSTDEDKPLKSPPSVYAHNTSSKSLSVSWTTISKQDIPGHLLGYRVYYSPMDSNITNRSSEVGPLDTSLHLTELEKYTLYRINVSGFTIKGDGPSKGTYVRTDEDEPSKPPSKLAAHNTSSTSILVDWQPIPSQYTHGIIKGYVISYQVTAKSSINYNWTDIRVKGPKTSVEIPRLEKFTKYSVQVCGYTIKGKGHVSKAVNVWTDEDVPDAFPANVTGFNKSSTELYLEWLPLQEKQWNGRPVGYKIFYSPKKTYDKHTLDVSVHTKFLTLEKLFKFTWYKIQVAAVTSKGLGPKSPEIELLTSEDVPSQSVITVKAKNTSHKSLLVEWKPIPSIFIHGILQGYRIQYWVVSNHEDEQLQKTGPDASSIELKDLLIYTMYAIRILGFTSAGDGVTSPIIHVTTDEYTPVAPPVNLRALNKTSPTKIRVYWEAIKNPYEVSGILRGYKLFYKPVAVSNQTIKPHNFTELDLKPKQTSIDLQDLSAFTRYHFYVLAYTVKGNGVRTHIVVAETCNCHRMLHTNWWPSPPYVEDPGQGSLNNSGIVPRILENAVKTCCEHCAEFEETQVNYSTTPNGKPAMKKGLQEFKENIDDAELSFPVYGFMDQKVYSSSYGFAPLVASPGVAMIVIGDEEGTAAKILIRSIILCWPIVFLDLMLLWVLSIVIWFVETFANKRHFPHNMLQGTWEGMWWAFSSMTTLGYGDRIPRTPIGRIICIVWILIGVILIACFNSTMTSILTARILDKDIMLYGTKIAAIQNSSEYRFGVRKNARVNPSGNKYSNLQEIYEALVNRDVKGILIDAYTAGSRSELFNRTDIRITKLFDYSSAYGVVMGGESKKLQQCFHSYLSEQRSFVSNIIEKSTQIIKESKKTVSVKRSQGLFDPKFPTYLKTIITCSAIFLLLFLVGAKFECAKKIGWITFNKSGSSNKYREAPTQIMQENKETLRREMSDIVEVFFINCRRTINLLKYKHLKELQQLGKLKKENNYGAAQKGSLTKNNLWTIKCNENGNVFASSLFKNHDHRNGQSNGFSFPKRFKKSKELETVV